MTTDITEETHIVYVPTWGVSRVTAMKAAEKLVQNTGLPVTFRFNDETYTVKLELEVICGTADEPTPEIPEGYYAGDKPPMEMPDGRCLYYDYKDWHEGSYEAQYRCNATVYVYPKP